MDFKIRSDTTESGGIRRRPPDYSSRAVRLRLGTLIALLGVAIIAMYEAGKPETWEKLGFVSDPATAETKDSSSSSADGPFFATAPNEPNDFWARQFQRISLADRKLLFQLVDERLQQKEFSGNAEAANQLLNRIGREIAKQKESGDEIAIESAASITGSLKSWIENGSGAIAEHDEVNNAEALQEMQNALDRSAYSLVEDRSSLGRSAESLAWIRSWKKLETFDDNIQPKEVNIVELTGQPDAYRGKRIQISGTARGLEQIEVASADLAFANYFVLWIKPREMSRTPYCVYVRSLPADFPDPNGSFQNIDEPVSIDGIFFKLRSYVATDDQIETCPLIVANSVTWIPVLEQQASDSSWQPPVWMLTLFFVGMPIVAAWLALTVYRSTKVMPIQTLNNEQQTISDNLVAMSENETIKSDRERVEELRRQLNEESDLP